MVYTSPSKCGRIVELYHAGHSAAVIAHRFNITRNTVYNIVNRFRRTKSCYPQLKAGRPAKLSKQDRKYAVLLLDRGHTHNVAELQREHFQNVHPITLRRALRKEGLVSAIRRRVPYLSTRHRNVRRVWAEGVGDWSVDYWQTIIFSDECKIELSGTGGRDFCWRRPGDALQARYMKKTWKSGNRGVMVWGCITEKGVGCLHRITRIMTATEYIKILDEQLLGTLRDYGMSPQHYFFQHDNDPKHSARITSAWLEKNKLRVLPWPSQSPDMNIIEHVWAHLKAQVQKRVPQPGSAKALWEVVQQEWYGIDTESIQSLYCSMPKHVGMLKTVKGGYTGY